MDQNQQIKKRCEFCWLLAEIQIIFWKLCAFLLWYLTQYFFPSKILYESEFLVWKIYDPIPDESNLKVSGTFDIFIDHQEIFERHKSVEIAAKQEIQSSLALRVDQSQ